MGVGQLAQVAYVKGMNTLRSTEQDSEVGVIDKWQELCMAHRKLSFNYLKFSIVALLIKIERVTSCRLKNVYICQHELWNT
jgi:hypothetical protein